MTFADLVMCCTVPPPSVRGQVGGSPVSCSSSRTAPRSRTVATADSTRSNSRLAASCQASVHRASQAFLSSLSREAILASWASSPALGAWGAFGNGGKDGGQPASPIGPTKVNRAIRLNTPGSSRSSSAIFSRTRPATGASGESQRASQIGISSRKAAATCLASCSQLRRWVTILRAAWCSTAIIRPAPAH